MPKLIFYDQSQFLLSENIKIKFHSPKPENQIFFLDENHVEKAKCANYLSVIRDPVSQQIYLYYASDTSTPFKAKTLFATSIDGITFEKPHLQRHIHNDDKYNNILLEEKCLSNNLLVFYDQNPLVPLSEKWKGIGGLHISWWYLKDNTSANDPIRKILPNLNYINLKPEVSKKLNHPNDVYKLPHPAFVRYRKAPKKGNQQDPDQSSMFLYLDPELPDPQFRGNGIHLITSGNGLDWNLNFNNKKPIISGMHPGHYDLLYICSHYDCHPSCFYDPFTKDYKLYLRSNVNYGVRHCQVTTSKDLLNWTPMKFITFDPEFNIESDNYYSANCFPYPEADNIYIGFPPYFKHQTKNSKNSFIALAFSNNGYNWKIKHKLITPELKEKGKITSFTVAGLILSNDQNEHYFYEHRYRSKILPDKRPDLFRYSIRRDGFTSVESKDGYLVIEITFSKIIDLNFKTDKDGVMVIILSDKTNKTFYQSPELKGNHLNYPLEHKHLKMIGEKGFMKIILKKCKLFCINTF